MQLSYAFLIAIAATLVSSQSVSQLVAQLPSCAVTCLASASSASGCSISDYACQCGSKKSAITTAATPCVLKACSNDDALKTNSLTGQICKAAEGAAISATSTYDPVVASSFPPTYTPSSTATISTTTIPASSAGASATYPASATSSSPAQVTANAASRLDSGVIFAGAAMLVAFAL